MRRLTKGSVSRCFIRPAARPVLERFQGFGASAEADADAKVVTRRRLASALLLFVLFLSGPSVYAATRTIRGRLVDQNGTPIAAAVITAQDIQAPDQRPSSVLDETNADGSFELTGEDRLYVLIANPLPPLAQARRRVDTRSTSPSGVEIVTGVGPDWPDTPPNPTLITIGTPDPTNRALVRGLPGSVPADSFVVFILLDTGHFTSVLAQADGSFEASIFAPPGSSLMVKADPDGVQAWRMGLEASEGGEAGAAPLAGTILRVPERSGLDARIPFSATGLRDERTFPVWRLEGSVGSISLARGQDFDVDARLSVLSSIASSAAIEARLGFLRLSDAVGSPALTRGQLASTVFTPTGLPIERSSPSYRRFEPIWISSSLQRVSPDRLECPIKISGPIPADYQDGYYLPVIELDLSGVPEEPPGDVPILNVDHLRLRFYTAYLPIVRLGTPSVPRLPWTLLTDTLSNGTRGATAVEDQNVFALSTRIVTQSDVLTIPMADSRRGRPTRYRLEPFLPTVSRSDRTPPGTPLIPLRLPSGALTVTIDQPDGTRHTIGPAPFVQARSRSPVNRAGMHLDGGGGNMTDVLQLSTMDPRFEVEFTQQGRHTITLSGFVEDIWGWRWDGVGTYIIDVARPLVLDSAVIPGTPFTVGDSFTPAVQIVPGVAADVELTITIAELSDAARTTRRIISGRANEFGRFTSEQNFVFDVPGEYRVDLRAAYRDRNGRLWSGARTWGSVIAPESSTIAVHGRRGFDKQSSPRLQWFRRTARDPSSHVFLPWSSGDVTWLEKFDAVLAEVTLQDLDGAVTDALRRRLPFNQSQFDFEERVLIGELPFFSNSTDDTDPGIDVSRTEMWGYAYRSIQRPSVAVRELVAEEGLTATYWRFNDGYARQLGVGSNGDLPNDFKFQFAGGVLRGPAVGTPRYGTYGSLFVLVPEPEASATRTMPPFQGNGGGPSGGALFTLKGREIDLFFHPTGARPGAIVESGELACLSGYSAPTLPSKIEMTITSPSGERRVMNGQANRIGYFHDPAKDFMVAEPGVWRIKTTILFDGITSAGQVTAPFPSGDVLGSQDGEFSFYVVDPRSPQLELEPMPQFVRPADGPISFTVKIPAGLTSAELHYTTTMPGFILEEGMTTSSTYTYDAPKLALDHPNLDLHDVDGFAGADTITISLLLTGTDAGGIRRHFARRIVIQGEEVQMSEQRPVGRRRAVRK